MQNDYHDLVHTSFTLLLDMVQKLKVYFPLSFASCSSNLGNYCKERHYSKHCVHLFKTGCTLVPRIWKE